MRAASALAKAQEVEAGAALFYTFRTYCAAPACLEAGEVAMHRYHVSRILVFSRESPQAAAFYRPRRCTRYRVLENQLV